MAANRAFLLAGTIALGCALARLSDAAVVAGSGFEYSRIGSEKETRALYGIAAIPLGMEGNGFAQLVRYDDSLVGLGLGLSGGIGLPVAAGTLLRISGARFIGDETYRAWRAKAGPELRLASSRLGLFFTHYEDNQALVTNGGSAEWSIPVAARVVGRAQASYAAATEGPNGGQASLGVDWEAIKHFEFTGEAGVARNGSLVTEGASPSRVPTLPLLGGDQPNPPTSSWKNEVSPVALVGVRMLFP